LIRLGLLASLLGLLASPVWAQPAKVVSGPPRHVIDDVNFFTESAKEQANRRIADIKKQFNKDFVIEATKAPSPPKGLDVKDQKAVVGFCEDWAEKRSSELSVQGVYVVLTPNPRKIRIEIGKATQTDHFFSQDDRKELERRMKDRLGKNDHDAALLDATTF